MWLQVLSAATVVAKHTSALCNACRLASSKTDNPVAKRHFVQSAKDVANSTANLVKAIKVNRAWCLQIVRWDAVDEMLKWEKVKWKYSTLAGEKNIWNVV